MTKSRLLILLLGPAPILIGSLGLVRWAKPSVVVPAEGNHVVHVAAATLPPYLQGAVARQPDAELEQACRLVSSELRERLGDNCQVIERSPFVIAGDLNASHLHDWYEKTIGPAARAMAESYFRIRPDEPITVLLFSGEHSYDHFARTLYGDAQISVYGYYKRGHRVLVMNAATGAGTVVHELTHALADFDCPQIPHWFNEGLASLHEQCRIRSDESGIDGLENWRLPILQQAIEQQRLRSLESLITADDFRMHDVALNYAQARYFCMWLQRQGLLESFFERWRANQAVDPMGGEAARSLFPPHEWSDIDRDFQRWVRTLDWQPAATTPTT